MISNIRSASDMDSSNRMNETFMEEENNEGFLNYVNQLKVLQDKTASRDQFVG
jgi:hypothetical protein